jgi:hypothetical protein
MSTPLGSFPNVIRVHEFSVTTDSVFVVYGGVTYFSMFFKRDTINKYLFWAPAQRHPVAIAYCSNSGVLQRIEYVSWAQLNVPEVAGTLSTISVYPNPVSDITTIQIPEEYKNTTSTVRLFDISGKLISERQGNGFQFQISVKNFDKGMYFVEIETGSGKVFKKDFVVN